VSAKTDWSADPALRDRIMADKARGELVRTAVIWTPPFIGLGGGALFFLIDQLTGPNYGATPFLVGLLSVFAVLVGYLSTSAWRDLAGGATQTEGYITRRWSRRDSLVIQTRYIRVGSQILRVDPVVHADLRQGDYVRVAFYSHSQVAVRIEQLPDPAAVEASEPLVIEPQLRL
jgi:hypothetical protein